MSQSFVSQVSAVTPLGEAIDGAPRPKLRRERKPSRDFDVDAHREFACPNKNCDHREWTEHRQLQHLGQELFRVISEFQRVDPENPAVLLHTGGVIVRDLTDEECRTARSEWARLWRAGQAESAPAEIRLKAYEYDRRVVSGRLKTLTPEEVAERRRQRSEQAWADMAPLSDDEVRDARVRYGYLKSKGRPVPEDLYRKAREYDRRARSGTLKILDQDELARRREMFYPRPDGHELWTDEEVRAAANEATRLHRKGQSVPQELHGKAAEYKRRMKNGLIKRRTAEEMRVRRAADLATRCMSLPPSSELRSRREALGLSAEELAERIGSSASAVLNWERGRYVPSRALLGPYLDLLMQPAARPRIS